MSLRTRLGFFATGVLFITVALLQMQSGQIVFQNASYHQTTFAAAGVGTGILFLLLALLPGSDSVYKHITTLRRKPLKRHTHSQKR